MNPPFTSFPGYLLLKFLFLGISVVCLVGIIYLLLNTDYLKERFTQDLIEVITQKPYGLGRLARRWRTINKRLNTKDENQYKLAVIEADSMLDEILERMNYEGDSFEERLDQIPEGRVSDLDGLKKAHQIRNSVAYDPDYRLDLKQAEKLLKTFEKTLRELEAF